MVPAARWLVVALLALAVSAPPVVLRYLPASDSDIGAVALAQRVRASTDLAWSGEVRAQGSLEVPLGGSTFGGLARLLGERTQLRVWWRDAENWRVDRITPTGETDQLREGGFSIRWRYEQSTARLVTWSAIRLPDDNDIVPNALAARLLSGAKASELSRIPPRRVAGRSAVGLRLVPADPMSTIARVDVWSDTSSGVPLRVAVYGDGDARHPVLSSEAVSFDPDPPSNRAVSFEFSPDVDFERGTSFDAVASANAFAPFLLPADLVGLDRHGAQTGLGAVGVYGRGPTALLVVPLRGDPADELAKQLARSQNARKAGLSVALDIGPLSVLLVRADVGNFLLIGTIKPASLEQAASELERTVVRTR
jgi:hypothetical protein